MLEGPTFRHDITTHAADGNLRLVNLGRREARPARPCATYKQKSSGPRLDYYTLNYFIESWASAGTAGVMSAAA